MQLILEAENVQKTFGGRDPVLKGVSFTLEKGSFTVMLGPSGSGKSTLLQVLSSLLKPTAGRVWCAGRELGGLTENELASFRRSDAGYIFQNYLLLQSLTVRENIELGVSPDRKPLPFAQLCRLLELEELLDHFPAQLSGGQQQRAAIARAVIKRPEILFCDEVTGALDEANSKQVVHLLHSLCEGCGVTVLFVTHNRQIARTADRVLTLKDGLLHRDMENPAPIQAREMVWE